MILAMNTHLPSLLAFVLLSAAGVAKPPADDEATWKKFAERDNQSNATGVCQVHQVAMIKTEVPIHYGLPGPPGPGQPSHLQRATLFPHARKFVLGGCCPIPDENQTSLYVCPSCLAAEKKWLAANKKG